MVSKMEHSGPACHQELLPAKNGKKTVQQPGKYTRTRLSKVRGSHLEKEEPPERKKMNQKKTGWAKGKT